MSDPHADEVLYGVDGGVATVTLNRPARLNAVTPAMQVRVVQRLRAADSDPGVRAVVLTGAGRGFCSGADLGGLEQLAGGGGSGAVLADGPDGQRGPDGERGPDGQGPADVHVVPLLRSLSVPVVAAVNGPVAGMGFSWMVAADLRFAAEGARISATFPRLGLVAEWGVGWLLPRLVGSAAAADLLLSGRTVDAAEALALGLVSRVLRAEELLPAAQGWAAEVAGCSPRAVAQARQQLAAAWEQPFAAAYEQSLSLMVASFAEPDLAEAVTARAERRAPAFPSYVPHVPSTPSEGEAARDQPQH